MGIMDAVEETVVFDMVIKLDLGFLPLGILIPYCR
jgi:hypothetical protein